MSAHYSSGSCRTNPSLHSPASLVTLALNRQSQEVASSRFDREAAKGLLISLLDNNRQEFATKAVDAIWLELADSHYTLQTRDELRVIAATEWVNTLIHGLAEGPTVLWPSTGLMSPAYLWKVGYDISGVVQAGLLINPLL